MLRPGERIAVVGAGIVGVASALELQRLGAQVTLIDRAEPGRETSFGNAGVIARSSLVPFNHPGLWAALPALASNRAAGLRYRAGYLARNLPWLVGFLRHASAARFEATACALDALIRLSGQEHRRLLHLAGAAHRLRETGWLHLYRDAAAWQRAAPLRAVYERFGVDVQALDAPALRDLEPHLRPVFARALWIRDSASVDSPLAVLQAYVGLFVATGGRLVRAEVRELQRAPDALQWHCTDAAGTVHAAERVVLALGPWSRAFLARLGLRVPMALERGYHMHYAAPEGTGLGRPIHDSAGGYVLTPMEQGLRLCTGVELNDLNAPPDPAPLERAEASAGQAFALGPRLDREPWLGRRPTLPDSVPVIGPAPRHPGVWLAFGHQHIGFSTGPGTARVLGALMSQATAPIDAAPFRPERWVR